MSTTFKTYLNNLAELNDRAAEFIQYLQKIQPQTVAVYGEMGAGKTTFLSAVLRKMNVDGSVSSPTFALINEYRSSDYGKIFHCDFYRLKNFAEALDLGVEEMLDSGVWCFVEWPEKLGNLLPEKHVELRITDQNGSRLIEAKV